MKSGEGIDWIVIMYFWVLFFLFLMFLKDICGIFLKIILKKLFLIFVFKYKIIFVKYVLSVNWIFFLLFDLVIYFLFYLEKLINW